MRAGKKENIRMNLIAMLEDGKKSGMISAYQLGQILAELEVDDDQRENMTAAVEAMGICLVDNKTVDPDEASFDKLRELAVEEALRETLTAREREVIRYRYGLADGTQWTLQKVAKKFGVTRERVRQIEAGAMCKLRDSDRAVMLKEYAC